MAMRGHLIRIDAVRDDGLGAIMRLASVNDARLCHLDDVQWDPAIARLPTLSYDFFGGAFQNAIAAPQAQFAVAVAALAQFPTSLLARLRFADARVRVWSGDVGAAFTSYVLRFDGLISAEPEISDQIAQFTARPDDRWLDAALLPVYAGTGGIEGGADLTGSVKPVVFGACQYVPGVQIDAVDNIYQVSAGSVAGISAAFDKLVSLGPAAGDHANLAALLAATIAPGSWATCLAQGLVRLGAPADGKLCFHVSGENGGGGGFVRLPGSVIGRIVELAGGAVAAGNLAAVNLARPWPLARVLNSQVTARQVIQEIADSVAAVAGVGWRGGLFVQPLGIGAPVAVLNPNGGSLPLVSKVAQAPVAAPFWRLATQAEPTWVVHETAEIASEYILRGPYSAARINRLDDLVFADDGRAFVYVNTSPSAGNAPPVSPATSNAWWQQFGSADNTATSQVAVDPIAAITVTANSSNVTTTDLSLIPRRIVIRRGETDVSASATFTAGTAPGGIAGAFGSGADANLFTLTQCDAAGSFPVTVTFAGVSYAAVIEIERVRAAAAVSGGTGNTSPISDASFEPISSSSFVTVAEPGIIASDGSGELSWSASAQYYGEHGTSVAIKAQHSPDGTTWTDAAAATTGSTTVLFAGGYYLSPGFVAASGTVTGLPPSTDYYWRLLARLPAVATGATFNDENFLVEQP